MKTSFDLITALIVIALIASIIAFVTQLVPYPYGWMVLSVLLVFRLTSSQKQKQ